ncbi:MAG: tetratricopeptide repeat protein [Gemmatimonas sp.]|nr:tetratricopeptide repeat protein [Gemmatimonas sp.]
MASSLRLPHPVARAGERGVPEARVRAAALLLLALLAAQWERGAQLAEAGDLVGAEHEYRALLEADPENAEIHYNLGTVLVLQERYEEARPHLEAAAAIVGEEPPRAPTMYNLGATDLQPAFADTALPEREMRLRRSIEAYKDALRPDPADQDAKWNLELARRLLESESPPPSSGGGGGGGDGAGGGDGEPDTAERDPTPQPAGDTGSDPAMSRAEADELLDAAQEQELAVQRDRLRKPQPAGPIRP